MSSFIENIRNLERESATMAALMVVATPSAVFSAGQGMGTAEGNPDTVAQLATSTGLSHSDFSSPALGMLVQPTTMPAWTAVASRYSVNDEGGLGAGTAMTEAPLAMLDGTLSSLQSDYVDFPLGGENFMVSTVVSSGLADASEAFDNPVDGLSSLLARLVEDAERAQADFSAEFNGERQGAVRGFIDDAGHQFSETTRDFFQDSVRGQVKGLLENVVDHTGSTELQLATDPVFAVDYYGTGATLVNSGLHAVPIGAITLPQLGPLVAQPQSALSDYWGR
ncbi:hypothetical protein NQT62_09255 [Limnobacter humi]|uniref:Uncharacterized protein n=1 Tax=Limnobacter humi TaxID=1778671 RepID=A0ABT1WIB5_9BURK|nr:hypothetical protein [Limnobacter humi]MCQ8896618.1 hypothetical protein [Limnobacter humi]